ncbi:N-acetylneuraminate synthase [Clostridium sp. KLE 1755]|uniref:N-acetylneuraminate synthase n=1 Tax=Clostridia TaxID=186801 RepID=UPI000397E7AC|nr:MULTISPECIES: N-acetylneuraminate synthase [Clostridia]ERI68238.1 N-acetylneuraminate synthase [Clostridium sp. KLE 1755]MDU5289764.1 N-acetylneuraminate synthase [Clostridium sp.]
MGNTFIIAEAGDNHNGNFENALKLVDAAVEAGADCVKFQTFVTEEIITKNAKMAEYQINNTGCEESQFSMVKKLELSFYEFKLIKKYCDEKKIMFLSTPFDIPSIEFLEELNIPIFKIPSGEVTNLPYLVKIAQTGKSVILSTGMCEVKDIQLAIQILEDNGCGTITLLHCNTEYPTPYEDVNLNAMTTMRKKFKKEVGYSDHTLGIEVPVAAVAMGATVIEKHFTLDKTMPGPDHKASLEPDELKEMIIKIRNIEKALGDGVKRVSNSERKNITIARKSIVARKSIARGELFTEDNLAVKRPGNGMSPLLWNKIIGTKANKDYVVDELIKI